MKKDKYTEKQAFNRALCFTFFGNWYEVITNLETDADKESVAYTLFKAIAEYSLFGVRPDSENLVIKSTWPLFETEIDNTINRRQRGFGASELSEKHKSVLELHCKQSELTYRELEKITGVPKSTVARLIERYGADYSVCNAEDISSDVDTFANDTGCSNGCCTDDCYSDYYVGDTSISRTGQWDRIQDDEPF